MHYLLPANLDLPRQPAAGVAWPRQRRGRGRTAGSSRRRWLHLLWLCTVFSALHGLLGAWVVPAVASGPVAEICTPTGMQWVVLDGAPTATSTLADPAQPANPAGKGWPQGLAQPCVWAMAHVATPPSPLHSQLPPGWITQPATLLAYPSQRAARLPATAERVLLMAPMRAPPSQA